ncbi:MAG: copper chaperone Copz family protein [Deltaproteobacteria bacterium]|nr:copper chaperone Copz family protein [Deltaproteobacteria bacterium]
MSERQEECCAIHPPIRCGPEKCSQCGMMGKPVKKITLGALLKAEKRNTIPTGQEEFCFCRNPDCAVVYFALGQILYFKEDLSQPIYQKERQSSSTPVCYCFGWTVGKIRQKMERGDGKRIVEQITGEVKRGNCYCEITNPQGSCCLGNVSQVIAELSPKKSD